MNERTRKQIGALIMASCAVGFFASFIYFFGSSTGGIEYTNLNYMLKLACTFGFVVFGLFFGLLFYGGKKLLFSSAAE
jgi:hypothetical protein